MTTHPLVDMVTFTGSTATGRAIMAAAARRSSAFSSNWAARALDHLGRCAGGHVAGMGIITSMIHAGQGCAIQTRCASPEHLLDAYVEGATNSLGYLKVGDPREADTMIGPLIREQQRAARGELRAVRDRRGSRTGLRRKTAEHLTKGFFYEPTLFVNARNDMRIAQEEIFGPVLTVITYDTEDEAIRIANDSIFGLGGGVMAGNTARGFNVARQIRAGNVSVQTVGPTNNVEPSASGPGWSADQPNGIGITGVFGGFKHSGVGREWGHHGIEEFTELKSIAWS